jgi:hypothetical protein
MFIGFRITARPQTNEEPAIMGTQTAAAEYE